MPVWRSERYKDADSWKKKWQVAKRAAKMTKDRDRKAHHRATAAYAKNQYKQIKRAQRKARGRWWW